MDNLLICVGFKFKIIHEFYQPDKCKMRKIGTNLSQTYQLDNIEPESLKIKDDVCCGCEINFER